MTFKMNKYILAGILAISLGGASVLTSCKSDDVVIDTTPIIKEVVTGNAEVTATSATVTGTVTGLKGQSSSAYTVGVIYSTNDNPTLGGSKVLGALGEDGTTVTATVNGLQNGITYYYATYVTLQGMVTEFGEVKSFVTTDAAVGTAAPASVTAVSANLGGTLNGVQDKIDAGVLEYGIAVAPQGISVQDGVKLLGEGSSNSFTIQVDGLVPNTVYTYAAYMVLNNNVIYGNEQTLSTPIGINASAESENDYVDMGTRFQWCRYNVGSTTESAPGALLGYGDLAGFNQSVNLSDYAQGDISNTERDAAVASGMGIIPTLEDWNELLSICDKTSTEKNGVTGILLTSQKTGNSIFLPAGGKREGAVVDDSDLCYYWTGTASATNSDYANLYCGDRGMQNALRSTGALVRPVRRAYVPEIVADASLLAVGDIEGNGRIRIEIYNEWGSTKENCPIDITSIAFEKQMVVDFTISGINDNLKEGAVGSYRAGFEYADASWDPSYWSGFNGNSNDCIITGDGSYRVKFDTWALTESTIVFCIDIDGLGADLADPSLVKVEDLRIQLDPKAALYKNVDIAADKVVVCNKDDNGTDLRVELYNEYGPTNDGTLSYNDVVFGKGTTTASVTLTGITGNLKEGASGNYVGAMCLAAASWWPSYWGGGAGNQTVTGDGEYFFQAPLNDADAVGAVVWVIDIAGLWEDLVDPTLVKAVVNSVVTPVHPQ